MTQQSGAVSIIYIDQIGTADVGRMKLLYLILYFQLKATFNFSQGWLATLLMVCCTSF